MIPRLWSLGGPVVLALLNVACSSSAAQISPAENAADPATNNPSPSNAVAPAEPASTAELAANQEPQAQVIDAVDLIPGCADSLRLPDSVALNLNVELLHRGKAQAEVEARILKRRDVLRLELTGPMGIRVAGGRIDRLGSCAARWQLHIPDQNLAYVGTGSRMILGLEASAPHLNLAEVMELLWNPTPDSLPSNTPYRIEKTQSCGTAKCPQRLKITRGDQGVRLTVLKRDANPTWKEKLWAWEPPQSALRIPVAPPEDRTIADPKSPTERETVQGPVLPHRKP
jgi:hypothetical protein